MRSSWQADLIVPAAQAISEAICLYAYVLVLTPADAGHADFATFAALFVAAAWVGRCSRHFPRRGRTNPWLLLPPTLLLPPIWWLVLLAPSGGWTPQAWSARWLMFLHAPDITAGEIFVFTVLTLAVWCRGVWLGLTPASTDALGRRLVGGMAALLLLFALLALGKGTGVERFTASLRWLVLGYFVLTPSTLALVHLDYLHRSEHGRQSASFAWLVALVTPITLIVAVGLSLAFGVAPVLRQILHLLAWISLKLWQLVLWGFYWPLMLLAWLGSLLLRPLPNSLRSGEHPHIPPPGGMPGIGAPYQLSSDIVFGALIGIALLLTALLLRSLLRRVRALPVQAGQEERSSVWSWAIVRAQLRMLWLRLIGGPRNRSRRVAAMAASRQHAPDRPNEAADIRALYRRLLRWAAAHGHARRAATTPDELRRELIAALPAASAAVTLLTRHYEQARYADASIGGEALAASRAASESLDALGEEGAVRH